MGADTILRQIANGVAKSASAFWSMAAPQCAKGAEIVDQAWQQWWPITSGGFGPTLQAPVAMGYVPIDLAAVGTQLNALVRGRSLPITVTKMPLGSATLFSRLISMAQT